MRLGQTITMIDPDFGCKRWIGFRGEIIDNPFMDICRSQYDVTIEGDWEKLGELMCGFHWMMSYGDYRKEVGYALRKLGVDYIYVGQRGDFAGPGLDAGHLRQVDGVKVIYQRDGVSILQIGQVDKTK